MELVNSKIPENAANEAEIIDVNGKMCLIHYVKPEDSIPRLSLMYNVDGR